MLSKRQGRYLEALRNQTIHPIEVVEEPVSGKGVLVLYCTFPGIYLSINSKGELIDTQTKSQWAACESVRQ